MTETGATRGPDAPPERQVWRGVCLSLAAVLALALFLRLPRLQLVPHLTDETAEVLWAHEIAFAGARPLTHCDSYNGPAWPYVLAAALRLAGSSSHLPRTLALLLGTATVGLTFALGWQLSAPLASHRERLTAATIAGLGLATNFTHAVIGSRVAWSNNSTPLWTTLTVLALLGAVRRRSGGLLVVSGALGGLALQSHPSVLIVLIALAVWFLLKPSRRQWLGSPWPWLAAAAAIVAYGPVILHNLATDFDTLDQATASRNIAFGEPAVAWAHSALASLLQLGRSLAGGFWLDGPDATWRPVALIYLALGVACVFAAALDRRSAAGRRLPAVVLLAAALGLPLANRNWHGLLEARYLGFAWPLVYACVGVVAARWLSEWRGWRRRVVALGLVVFVAVPAARVLAFDRAALAEQYDNRRLLNAAALAAARHRGGARVFVDPLLKEVPWRAGGHPRRAVEYLLTMDGVPYERAPESEINHYLSQAGSEEYVLFLTQRTYERLAAAHRLTVLDDRSRRGEGRWGLYVHTPGQ